MNSTRRLTIKSEFRKGADTCTAMFGPPRWAQPVLAAGLNHVQTFPVAEGERMFPNATSSYVTAFGEAVTSAGLPTG